MAPNHSVLVRSRFTDELDRFVEQVGSRWDELASVSFLTRTLSR